MSVGKTDHNEFSHRMAPLKTIIDEQPDSSTPVLNESLQQLYGGDLRISLHKNRPTMMANFVSSLDGIVSLNIPGRSEGSEISGHNPQDRMIMGILRTAADALMIGAGTLRAVPGRIRTAQLMSPERAGLFEAWRKGSFPLPPIQVIVSGSGQVDLKEPTFHTDGLRAVILTSSSGREHLLNTYGDDLGSTEIRAVGDEVRLLPEAMLRVLFEEYNIRLLLNEGGPTLFGEFLRVRLVDNLFLTLAPQLVGTSRSVHRLQLVEGMELAPDASSWFQILTEKASGSFRYLHLIPR